MMRLPAFSRSQLGVILLLGAALLLLYAWRAHVLFSPSPPPPGTLTLAFVEVTGKVAHPGVYSFPKPPTLRDGPGQSRGSSGNRPGPGPNHRLRHPGGGDAGWRLPRLSGHARGPARDPGAAPRPQPGHRPGPGRPPRHSARPWPSGLSTTARPTGRLSRIEDLSGGLRHRSSEPAKAETLSGPGKPRGRCSS